MTSEPTTPAKAPAQVLAGLRDLYAFQLASSAAPGTRVELQRRVAALDAVADLVATLRAEDAAQADAHAGREAGDKVRRKDAYRDRAEARYRRHAALARFLGLPDPSRQHLARTP